MQIIEIFESVQGEGRHLGMPAIFIRTAGCNLSCSFCDTAHSWDGSTKGLKMSPAEIVNAIAGFESTLIVITGGEPCMQKDLIEVIQAIKEARGGMVAIETNGTFSTPPNADWITCSPKPEAGYTIHDNCRANEFKYVVTEDFDPAVIPEDIKYRYMHNVWLQPDGFNLQTMWLKAYKLAMADHRLRVGVQLHKLMEVQ